MNTLDPLEITTPEGKDLSIPLYCPHHSRINGLIDAFGETADRPMLLGAFLGMCIRHPDVPTRQPGWSILVYGERVFDALEEMGGEYYAILHHADVSLGAAMKSLPDIPLITETEVLEVLGNSEAPAESS